MTDTRTWLDQKGQPLACKEKLIVLDEAFTELRQSAQDVLEDALLIGCQENQVREAMAELVLALDNPYKSND